MDPSSVVILALSLSWQSRWQDLQRNGRLTAATNARDFTFQDAAALGHRFGARFVLANIQSQADSWLLRSIESVAHEIFRYESPQLREQALNLIPFDALNTQAATIVDEEHLPYQDALVQALVKWAKREFLHWADPIKCSSCGGSTEGIAGGSPTSEERSHGAGRIEIYRCINADAQCRGSITRFPRYSSLEKLLQTRTGRCGEFAAVFMLLLRALNLRARYIWNSEDHVWNEYYSEHSQRWVHVDSCEGARDKNLLYDRGWGKKMKYCIAFGIDGTKDVTRSYVSNWQETSSRRDSRLEGPLVTRLNAITADLRKALSQTEIEKVEEEDIKEEEWLSDFGKREEIAARETLAGRTSGTKEWRSQRSELGGNMKKARPTMQVTKRIAGSCTNSLAVTCNGSATVDPATKQLRLTRDEPGQIGSAFLSLPPETRNLVFNCTFRIRHRGSEGADGMALLLHSDPRGVKALGDGGCDLGYGALRNCLAVEIDTYRSSDRCDDPPTPHISVHTAGHDPISAHHRHSLWCTKPGALPNLDDGRAYSIRLELSTSQQQLRIFFNDSPDNDLVELTTEPISVPIVLRDDGAKYIGWTAATGGLHQEHLITDFEVWEAKLPEGVSSLKSSTGITSNNVG